MAELPLNTARSRLGRYVLIAAALAAALLPASPAAAQEAELLAARDAIWRAWFANDSAGLARLLPEAAAAGSGDDWEDRASIVAGSRAFVAGGGKLVRLEFTDTKITSWGDVAVVTSHFTYETDTGGKRSPVSGKATEVFVRRNGMWVNPFWHLGSF